MKPDATDNCRPLPEAGGRDFVETADPFPVYHFWVRVSDAAFDAILGRLQAAGISYRSYARRPT